LVVTTDKLLVVSLLGLEQMGFYGIASIVAPLVLMLPQSLRQVVAVEVYRESAEGVFSARVRELYARSLRGLALVVPLLCGGAFLGAEWGVRSVLPKYLPGLGALEVLCLAMALLAMVQVCFDVAIAARRIKEAIAVCVATALFNTGVCVVLVGRGAGLTTVAAVHAVGYAMLAGYLCWRCARLVGMGSREVVALAMAVLTPMGYAALALVAVQWIMPSGEVSERNFSGETAWMLGRQALFVALSAPLLVALWRAGGAKLFKRG
jgi:O-antigen/teichoic acid export membrane protein